MTDEIIIPADSSPVKTKIVLTEDMLDRNAKQLLKGNKSSKMFEYFVYFIIGRILENSPADYNTIDDNLMELTIDQQFIEQQIPSYKFSTIKYKKYLQHFVKEIQQSILISKDADFSLLKTESKKTQGGNESTNYKVNSGTPQTLKFKKVISLGLLYDKTVEEIMGMTIAEYPNLSPNAKEKPNASNISEKDGWLISQFDTNAPLYDKTKIQGLFDVKNKNITNFERVGNKITLTIDTYTYFDNLLRDAGYKGLIKPQDGKEENVLRVLDAYDANFARPPDGKEGKKDFWYKNKDDTKSDKLFTVQYDKEKLKQNRKDNFYVIYAEKNTSTKTLVGDGLVLKNNIKGAQEGSTFSLGTFSEKREYKHTIEEIEKLRKHIKDMTESDGSTYNATAKLHFLKDIDMETDPTIDTLSQTESVNSIIDLLYTPKDRQLKVGVFEATYIIEDKIKKETLDNKDKFRNFILTNSQVAVSDEERQGQEIVRRNESKVIEEMEKLLEDVENNPLDKYANENISSEGTGDFPTLFFEQLLEEIQPTYRGATFAIYDKEVLMVEGIPIIDIDDTIESIEDKLTSEAVENNANINEDEDEDENEDEDEIKIVEAETGEEEEEKINKSYLESLKNIINSFKTETEKILQQVKSKNKNRNIPIITHQESKFTELATLSSTGGKTGGISSNESRSDDRLYSYPSGDKNVRQRKSKKVKELTTKNAIVRQVQTLKNAVNSIN